MEYLMEKVQTEYGFSEYQAKLIRFTLTAFLYDVSKMIIFIIYFYFTGKLIEFLFAAVPLIFLRFKTGGIHMKKYWTCFLFSFLYLCTTIYLLPNLITVQPLAIYLILLLCAVIDYCIGPTSLKKPDANKEFTHKAKIQAIQIICLVAVLFFVFPNNQYLIVSFWTVVLHTFQLAITKLLREVKCSEKLVQKEYI